MDLDRRFCGVVNLLVKMNAANSLDYLYHEVKHAHYLQLRTMLEKRCQECKNPFCSITGMERIFCMVSPSPSPGIIE